MNQESIENLKNNPDNPRTLSDFMEAKLTESILVFPEMLRIRPIIVNKDCVVIGGNMRVSALLKIAGMDDSEIVESLENQQKYRLMDEKDKSALLEYWRNFRKSKLVPCRKAERLTKEQEQEFLIKDNMHYGEDDGKVLRAEYDVEMVNDVLGSVPMQMLDFTPINESKEVSTYVKVKKFRCGYVEVIMTDEEERMLKSLFSKYTEDNFGTGDGFLSYLLAIQ